MIDNVLIYGLGIGILVQMGIPAETAITWMSLVWIVYAIGMPGLCKGYHIGKYLLGMKIVSEQFKQPSWGQLLKRELVKMSYVIPIIGIVFILISQYMMAAREDGKTLHDWVAKTQVITT